MRLVSRASLAEGGANANNLIGIFPSNTNDAYAYLNDILARLPTQMASRIGELLPHRWQPATI